jgi:hypothetical protein
MAYESFESFDGNPRNSCCQPADGPLVTRALDVIVAAV